MRAPMGPEDDPDDPFGVGEQSTNRRWMADYCPKVGESLEAFFIFSLQLILISRELEHSVRVQESRMEAASLPKYAASKGSGSVKRRFKI